MPSTINKLPEQVMSLPISAKKIFLKAFNVSFKKSKNESSALKIAWSAVKSKYGKVKGKWVIKKSVNINSVIGKSGFLTSTYFFEVPISSVNEDLEGDIVSDELLQKLANHDLIENSGDIEHLSIEGDNRFNGVFKLLKKRYENGVLYGGFVMDKKHPMYKRAAKIFKKGSTVGVSAEFFNPEKDGNVITDCSRLGWTFTRNPCNPDARVAL